MSGGPIANEARSYGSPSTSTECPSEFRRAWGGAATDRSSAQDDGPSGKVDHVGNVRAHGFHRRLGVPFRSQVAGAFLAGLAGATALLSAFCAPCAAADITNVTVITGPQLIGPLSQEEKQSEDVRAAVRYFEERGDKVNPNGLSVVRFQSNDEDYAMFFVPFVQAGATVKDGQERPTVLLAKGPKKSKALIGTIVPQPKGPPEVKDEKIVTNGKIESGNGEMRNFLKCATKDCLTSALLCLATAEGWPVCLCLGCGIGLATCGFTELFFPQ
jgi:hypothetical protein